MWFYPLDADITSDRAHQSKFSGKSDYKQYTKLFIMSAATMINFSVVDYL